MSGKPSKLSPDEFKRFVYWLRSALDISPGVERDDTPAPIECQAETTFGNSCLKYATILNNGLWVCGYHAKVDKKRLEKASKSFR